MVKLDHALQAPVRAVVNGDPSLIGHILSAGRKRAFQVGEALSAQAKLSRASIRTGPDGGLRSAPRPGSFRSRRCSERRPT